MLASADATDHYISQWQQASPCAEHVLHWSAWRRRHKARAILAHIWRRQRTAHVRLKFKA